MSGTHVTWNLWQRSAAVDVARHRGPARDLWQPDTAEDVARHRDPARFLWHPETPPTVKDSNNTSVFLTETQRFLISLALNLSRRLVM